MPRHDELTVITKTYDLILWSCNHTSRFPRNHRFVLGERIERNLYKLLETLIQAKYQRERTALLPPARVNATFDDINVHGSGTVDVRIARLGIALATVLRKAIVAGRKSRPP